MVLNHNIDELLVGIVRQVRYQQGGFLVSSSTESIPKNRNKVARFTNILIDKIMNIGHKEIPCTNLFDVWASLKQISFCGLPKSINLIQLKNFSRWRPIPFTVAYDLMPWGQVNWILSNQKSSQKSMVLLTSTVPTCWWVCQGTLAD